MLRDPQAPAQKFYVSPEGDDTWSGTLPEPDDSRTDGPFASLDQARTAVRSLKSSGELAGPLTVLLRAGQYSIDEPVVFTPEDSGPITYAAYPGEKPVLDGGITIDQWNVKQVNGVTTWVAEVPEVVASGAYFRQLFVNGERRYRARLPRDGAYQIEDVPGTDLSRSFLSHYAEGAASFRFSPGDIQRWRNLTDVEVVVHHFWVEERMPIQELDEASRQVHCARRSVFVLRDDFAQRFAQYHVENVFEALGEPGDWYLDRADALLYYVPLPGEDPATTQAVGPRADHLLQLYGDPETGRYVEYLRFQGLTFQHAEPPRPVRFDDLFNPAKNPWQPDFPFASAPQASCNVPGAVQLRGARHCAFESCVVQHVGGYAVEVAAGCHGNRFIGNELCDLGAGGIRVGGSFTDGPVAHRTGTTSVTDNHIHHGGRVHASGVGVLITHSAGNVVAHNHIHELYYSGVSCGWVWGFADSVSKNNVIEANHIHHIGHGLLSDMGGIYTLGTQPGTIIRGNLIHDVEKRRYGGWGIYLDEGSSHILVEKNVVYRTSSQAFNLHYGRENIVRNNIFSFGREGQVSFSRRMNHNAFTLQRNILLTDSQPILVGRPRVPLEEGGFSSDLNLYWDVSGNPPYNGNIQPNTEHGPPTIAASFSVPEWQQLGNDRHSIVDDPGFGDPYAGDFTLPEDSSAFSVGFEPIDMSTVGPRPFRHE